MDGTLAIIISVVSFGTVVFNFFRNNHKTSVADGERWGKLDASLEYIKGDLREIKDDIKKNATEQSAALEKHKSETAESIRRLHQRMNEHLSNEHNIKTT